MDNTKAPMDKRRAGTTGIGNRETAIFADCKIAIIGLGLIGGSLARAFRERLGCRSITAVSKNPEDLELALQDGNIDKGYIAPDPKGPPTVDPTIFDSDLIFLCTPVGQTSEYLRLLAGNTRPDCIITDVGSTKGRIMEFADHLQSPLCFIGGHPMAGTEKNGYAASFAHLFENAYYVLTPCRTASTHAIERMESLVRGIGAIPVIMDAQEHDRITGGISHIPHVIASAMVRMVSEMDTPDGRMQMLAAGGFRDITRIASSSPEMWQNIVLSNKQQVESILDRFIHTLEEFKGQLQQEDTHALYEFFSRAKQFRDGLPAKMKGPISPLTEIVVDVLDKPGIIGEIATVLGRNGVNIKNILVSNSREMEQGVLKITLSDAESANVAYDLLIQSGYRVFKSK